MNKKTIVIIFISTIVFIAFRPDPTFSHKTHGNVANYFESELEFRTFFDFHSGENVAEIGAGNGNNMRGFNAVAKEVSFYVQDIDEKTLNESAFKKILQLKSTNTFHKVIGTEKESNLPDYIFDKILLVSTFHEFSNMDEMMADIHRKLKPHGLLYILESHCYAASHKNITVDEALAIMEKNKFQLVKKELKEINHSSGLYRAVFRKI